MKKADKGVVDKVAEVVGEGFSVERFVESFDVLAEAAGGVACLRKLILELAVRGVLETAVNGDDEASLLRKRMDLDREQRLSSGTARQMQECGPVAPGERPFEVPASWEWTRIGAAMNLVNGRAFKPSDWASSGLPIIRIQNLNDSSAPFNYCNFEVEAKHRLKAGDFLISWSGTPGTSFGAFIWQGPSGVLNQHIFRAEVYGEVYDLRFLRIAINARLDEMIAQAHGAVGLQHITKGKLETVAIPLPPEKAQARIAAKVQQLARLCDDLEARQSKKREIRARLTKAALRALTADGSSTALTSERNALVSGANILISHAESVEELRQAVFALACCGALTRQARPTSVSVVNEIRERRRLWATEEVEKGNKEALRQQKKSEEQVAIAPVAPLPEGWEWATLQAASQQLVDCHNKTAPYTWSGVMLVRTTNVRGGRILLEGAKYVSEGTYQEWARRCPPMPGDVLFTREAPMGEAGMIEEGMRLCMGQRMMLIRPFPELLDPKYLLIALRDPGFKARMMKAAVGSTVKHLRVGDVESLWVPLPPPEEQRRIVAKVEHLLSLCDALEASLRRAEDRASRYAEAVVRELVA